MNPDQSVQEGTWKARRMQPVTVVYVLLVFLAFMAFAHFVVHSPEAVKALLLAAVGSIVPMASGVLSRVEYRLTATGLEKRPYKAKEPREFSEVFAWDDLSHVVPTESGFKFYKRPDEPNRFRRFLKLHVSEGHSGEVHLEAGDLRRIREVLEKRGIRTSKELPPTDHAAS